MRAPMRTSRASSLQTSYYREPQWSRRFRRRSIHFSGTLKAACEEKPWTMLWQAENRKSTHHLIGLHVMPYQVFPLRKGDLPSVTDIYNAACRARESTQGPRPWTVNEMEEFLFGSHPSFESYTCVHKEGVVGWAALTRFRVREDIEHTAEMSLYVRESHRRKGIGGGLARTLLSRASMLNLHCIFAIVFRDMPNVVSFAERKCGFSIAGCLPEVFSHSGKHYDLLVCEWLVSQTRNASS